MLKVSFSLLFAFCRSLNENLCINRWLFLIIYFQRKQTFKNLLPFFSSPLVACTSPKTISLSLLAGLFDVLSAYSHSRTPTKRSFSFFLFSYFHVALFVLFCAFVAAALIFLHVFAFLCVLLSFVFVSFPDIRIVSDFKLKLILFVVFSASSSSFSFSSFFLAYSIFIYLLFHSVLFTYAFGQSIVAGSFFFLSFRKNFLRKLVGYIFGALIIKSHECFECVDCRKCCTH